MKPDAILVNVARGAILDEEALYTHLKSHPGFMAGIDAWWTEPFLHGAFRMEYPFLELPNVIGSPHNSAVVSNVLLNATRQAAENVKHFLKGEKVLGIARREELALHLRAGRNIGVDPHEIAEVLLHVAVYAGIPAANTAFSLAKKEFDQPGRASEAGDPAQASQGDV